MRFVALATHLEHMSRLSQQALPLAQQTRECSKVVLFLLAVQH